MEEPTEPSLDEKTIKLNGTTDATDKKKDAILEACRQRDLGALRALAESPGGFLTDDIRQQACKLMLQNISAVSQSIDLLPLQGRYY